MQHILQSLTGALPTLSPQMQRAATMILENPGAVAVNSMRVMARTARVSPPTMLRLAHRLGFPNYDAFRDVFKEQVAGTGYGARAGELSKIAELDGVAGLARDTAAAAQAGMARFDGPAFAGTIDCVADIIAGAARAFIVASGASFGHAVSFHYVCRMALPTLEIASSPGLRPIDCLANIGPDDAIVAIAFSPYARATVDAAQHAETQGARITAITDSPTSPLARIADATVVLDTAAPHYFPSMIGLAGTLEVLSAAIAVKRGSEAITAISTFEAGIRNSDTYWEEFK